ncbi:glycosyltransferase involved in cell wall biosynthesis [Algoriphagus ratkowskyi]|uniref:Glycosyltransferase family 4 protein n=1 Tax=Algoriphagus ratkowskyi TaxID=57028 RepID=A0A2W7R6D7_9BACT|nr:glycosyltransferase family 4 protein [Algoriphagus ratkowskyi]PZX49679.1 glycosyltransferase involved in cell wall biosynthesis [Algoriphagus ratkowskyi]TXD75448.1 glycosyltransferase family 4 protein [Algoriphagus ratkowskyi]
MKIVFLHNDFKAYWRGRLYFLQNFFLKRNIQIHVVEIFGQESAYSFDSSENLEEWWDCLFKTEKFSELSTKIVSKKIMMHLDHLNPDILICGPTAFTSGAIGMRWAYKRNKKVIVFDDSKHSLYKRNFLVNHIKLSLTNLAEAIIVPSTDYDLEYAKWKIKKEKLYYGLNCIDNNYFQTKREIQFHDTKQLICIARLVPIKNLETLLNCWKNVEMANPDYSLVIVGDGPEHDNLVNITKNQKLRKVRFTGNQSTSQIAELLAESDAFILPSYMEGWAMVVNEAMAAGLPVILSDRINAGHTLLKNSINGFSFDPYNKEQITEAILKYINLSIAEKTSMSEHANLEIKKYNYDFLANQILLAVNTIQGQKRKSISLPDLIFTKLWSGKFKTSNWDTI